MADTEPCLSDRGAHSPCVPFGWHNLERELGQVTIADEPQTRRPKYLPSFLPEQNLEFVLALVMIGIHPGKMGG